MSFRIIDNNEGGYRAVLISDPSIYRDADTYGLAEAYGQEMVQNQIITARNAVYEKIDEERILADANALLARRKPGRPRKVAVIEDEPETAPVDQDHAA